MLAAGSDLVEADVGAGNVGAGQIVGLQALDLFASTRNLRGAGSCGKAGDEVVELGDLLVALGVLRFEGGANLRFGHHHVVVAAGVGDDGLIVDVGGVGGDAVEEVPIMGDGDQRAVVAVQEVLEPVDGFEIEVVGRLVEEQRLGLAERAWASSTRTF